MNCGGCLGRALELVDHLALGDRDAAERDGEAELRDVELDLDLADADLADEGMGAGIAALGRIAEREQKALVAARQRLQAQVAVQREFERLAGEVAGHVVASRQRRRRPRSGPSPPRMVGDARHRLAARLQRCCRLGRPASPAEARDRAGGACSRRSGRAAGRRAGPCRSPRCAARSASRRCRSAAYSRSAAASCDRRGRGRSPRSGRRAPA